AVDVGQDLLRALPAGAGERDVGAIGGAGEIAGAPVEDGRGLPAVGKNPEKSVEVRRGEDAGDVDLVPMIGAASGAVGGAIVGVDVGGAGEFGSGRVGEAMGPGRVGEHAEVVGQAVLRGKEQAVVAGGGARVEVGDGAVPRSPGWIEDGEQAAG